MKRRIHSGLSPAIFIPVVASGGLPAPAAPDTPTPANASATTTDRTPTFGWSEPDTATKYHIQVDDDVNFGSPLIDVGEDGSLITNSYTPGSDMDAEKTWYWRVRAGNSSGFGAWSDTWSFDFHLYALLAQYSFVIDYRFDEASGNIVNYGTGGAAANGTAANLTYAQAGQLGAGEAVDFNGTTSLVTVADITPVASLKTFTWMFLFDPDNGVGRLLNTTGVINWLRFEAAPANSLTVRIGAVTAAGQCASSALTMDAWQLLFVTYDDTGDRKPRIYRSTGGAVAEISNTLVAAQGTLNDFTGLTIGGGGGVITDGLQDEFGYVGAVLTETQMNAIVNKCF